MRQLLIALFVVICYRSSAQSKNNIFADVSIGANGGSVTYDRTLTKHLQIGGGLSSYYFHFLHYGPSRSALYVDLRPYWKIKRSLLFTAFDFGLSANVGAPAPAKLSLFGFHTALLFGYSYQINKRGMGPYASLGMYVYPTYIHLENPALPPRAWDYGVIDGMGQISVGFKF